MQRKTPTRTDSGSETEDVLARVYLGVFPEEAIRIEDKRVEIDVWIMHECPVKHQRI